jgi:excisionase family DNA binding protein
MTTVVLEGLDEALLGLVREAVKEALAEQQPEQASPWLDVAGAAEHLRTTAAAIRALVKRNAIPFSKTPAGRVLFDRQQLDQWVRGGEIA